NARKQIGLLGPLNQSWPLRIYPLMKKNKLVAFFDLKLKKRQVLRRYLDLPKFIDFLRTGELYLEPASNFPDLLEGTLPETIRKGMSELPDFIGTYDDLVIHEQKNKKRTYLNCWSLGAKDNMALWMIYGSTTKSVSITTTVNRLKFAAPSWGKFGRVNVKKVTYINFSESLPNGVYSINESLFRLKHVAHLFEKEVRIIITRPSGETPDSIRLPVNIDHFLTKIIVAPEAGEWFFNLVVDLVRKYHISVPVHRSELTILLNKAKAYKNKAGQPVISPER
ncbi:MAG: hypothetical protein KAW47_04000, partial [Thermoplasmatales archaeon]|nr:hypothetical protein [Thermoplasmatales archaeon]